MRLEIARGFLTQEECAFLNDWAAQGVENGWIDTGMSSRGPSRKHLTSRMYGHRFTTPEKILGISKKIREFAGVSSYPLVIEHGRSGIVVSYTYSGGDVFKHTDPRDVHSLSTLRCNVMTQKPTSGGILTVGDKQVELQAGDLHCYLATEHYHSVSVVEGDVPRILWMFGACVSADDWNSGRIKFGLS